MISPSHPTEPAAVALFREAVKIASDTHGTAVTATTLLGAACIIGTISGDTGFQDRTKANATRAISVSGRALELARSLHGDAEAAMKEITYQVATDAANAFTVFLAAGIDPQERNRIGTAPDGDPMVDAIATVSLAAVGAHGQPTGFPLAGDSIGDLQASLAAMDAALAAIPAAVEMIDRLQRAGEVASRIIRGGASAATV